MRKNKKRSLSPLMRSRPVRALFARTERHPNKPRTVRRASGLRPLEQAGPGFLFIVCLVAAIVVGGFVFHLHVRFEAIRLGYETSMARARRAQLLVEQRELRLEMASLKDPKRIEAEAAEKLDMEMPDQRKIIPVGSQRQPVLASGGAL